tara:strand:+ start:277 stop:870 length:594 start_codon:yes stop_codon:yes gene_type:complete
MNIKNKEPIQAALDSLEMALEHLEDQEEYTLNDVSIKDLWDIWEEASHQLGMSDDKGELKHFADGFHEGDWERDMERPWPGLDQILKDMNIPEEWESVKTLTWDEFTKKFGKIKTEVTKSGGYTTYTPEWIYESPDGKIVYRRKEGSDKRQLAYLHPQDGPPYTMFSMQGQTEWVNEDDAKKRHWYKSYVGEDESKT